MPPSVRWGAGQHEVASCIVYKEGESVAPPSLFLTTNAESDLTGAEGTDVTYL